MSQIFQLTELVSDDIIYDIEIGDLQDTNPVLFKYEINKSQAFLPESSLYKFVISNNEKYSITVDGDEGFQVEINDKSESMGKKAMEAQVQRFNYLVTVGEKEKSEGKIAVRKRDEKEIKNMTLEDFISKIQEEIASKTL